MNVSSNSLDQRFFYFFTHSYSLTDNLSPILVFDWLMFYCGNLILYQRRNENDKSTIFLTKNNKKYQESKSKYKLAFFIMKSPH